MKCLENQLKAKLQLLIQENKIFVNDKINMDYLKEQTLAIMTPMINNQQQKYELIKDLVVPAKAAMAMIPFKFLLYLMP